MDQWFDNSVPCILPAIFAMLFVMWIWRHLLSFLKEEQLSDDANMLDRKGHATQRCKCGERVRIDFSKGGLAHCPTCKRELHAVNFDKKDLKPNWPIWLGAIIVVVAIVYSCDH